MKSLNIVFKLKSLSDLNKALLLCCLMFLIIISVSLNLNQWLYGGDAEFHFNKARSVYFVPNGDEFAFYEYPPLWSWLSGLFAFNQKAFYFFSLFILCFVVPLVLWFVVRDWVSVLLYFSSGFVYYGEGGAMPHVLVCCLLFVFWFAPKFVSSKKVLLFRLLLVLLAVLTHSWGGFLLIVAWVFLLFEEKGLGFFGYLFSPFSNFVFLFYFWYRWLVFDFNVLLLWFCFEGLRVFDRICFWFLVFLFGLGFFVPRLWFCLVLFLCVGGVFWLRSVRSRCCVFWFLFLVFVLLVVNFLIWLLNFRLGFVLF